MNVTSYQQAFILHFGEMGSRWGINRTVGQMYALLYLSECPLNAEQICGALDMSRSNVSMGLKELKSWRLVKLLHLPGDRREYFSTPEDVWEILQTLLEERRKREIDPTLSMLRTSLMDEPNDQRDKYATERLAEMLELIELLTGWFDEMQDLDRETVVALMKLGGGVKKLINTGQRLRGKASPRRPH